MKVKVYRILGWVIGGLSGVVGGLVNFCQPDKFNRFISNPAADFLPAVYGILASIAFSPLLWAGALLFWRADRNEKTNEKSKWGAIIKGYLIFTIVMLVITAMLILIPNILRARQGS